MKKLGIFVLLLALLVTLCSCTDKSGAPSGMKLVAGGESEGYYFYVPEEWTISSIGNIAAAYASRVDRTSASFTEVNRDTLPTDADAYFLDAKAPVENASATLENSASGYFIDNFGEFPEGVEFTKINEPTPFGKAATNEADAREDADRARVYEYSYAYEAKRIGFVQIFIKEGDRYFIFTFSSSMEERFEGESYFAYHSKTLESIINSFRFVARTGENTPQSPEYVRDEDGYILISNKAYARFELYVPDTFVPEYSSAIVSATHKDGSNINMTQAVTTGVDIEDYWKVRKEDLEKIVNDLKIIKEIDRDEIKEDFGNSAAAFVCEYTYTYNGTKYHVMQIFCIDKALVGYGYALTYTATEDNYNAHLSELEKIIEKVRFG